MSTDQNTIPTAGSTASTAGKSAPEPKKPRYLAHFLVAQAILLYAAVSWASFCAARRDSRLELPAFRPEPLVVRPEFNEPLLVTDEQLQRILHKLRPQLRIEKPTINDIDHALRCWGLEARFNDPACLSGTEMRDLLLDHRQFAKYWGQDTRFLMVDVASGVRARTQDGAATSSHVDHTLASQAEIGTPLDYPIVTAQRTTSLQALLEQAARDFSLNQGEYEWSTLAFALYLPTPQTWYSQEGQEVTFDRLAGRLMRQVPSHGVCFGNHRLHTLAMLLRIDDMHGDGLGPILSPERRQEVLDHLRERTARLIANQHREGYFNGFWGGPNSPIPADAQVPPDSLAGRLLTTGHALEWWALAPQEVHPPREVLVRAGQWLARAIDELTPEQVKQNYTFLTHAGRALALWRGHFPAEVYQAPPAPAGANSAEKLTPDSTQPTPETGAGEDPASRSGAAASAEKPNKDGPEPQPLESEVPVGKEHVDQSKDPSISHPQPTERANTEAKSNPPSSRPPESP